MVAAPPLVRPAATRRDISPAPPEQLVQSKKTETVCAQSSAIRFFFLLLVRRIAEVEPTLDRRQRAGSPPGRPPARRPCRPRRSRAAPRTLRAARARRPPSPPRVDRPPAQHAPAGPTSARTRASAASVRGAMSRAYSARNAGSSRYRVPISPPRARPTPRASPRRAAGPRAPSRPTLASYPFPKMSLTLTMTSTPSRRTKPAV